MNDKPDNTLTDLLIGHLDSELTAAEQRHLAALIDDDAARRQFVETCYLVGLLAETATDEFQRVQGLRSAEFGLRSVAPKRESAIRTPQFAIGLAALITLALTAWFLFTPNPQPPAPNPSTATSPAVAMLSDVSDDAVFAAPGTPGSDRPMTIGADLPPGHIRLTAGTAQIMFASTAVVDLTGPCEFEMTGPNRGHLHAGRLLATVPPAAHGFTITTPDGLRLIDLGTRFTAYVDPLGNTRTMVREGRVRIESKIDSRELIAGELAMLEGDQLRVLEMNQPLVEMRFGDEPDGAVFTHDRSTYLNIPAEQLDRFRSLGMVDASDRFGIDGTTLYLSWRMRGPGRVIPGFAGLSLFDRAQGRSIEELFIGKANDFDAFSYAVPGRRPVDLDMDPATATPDLHYTDDQPHRLVARIDFNAGGDRVSIWLDPDPAADEPAQGHGQLDDVQLHFDTFRAAIGNGVGVWHFDDLKLGITWRSVVPTP